MAYFSWDRQTIRSRAQSELGYTGALSDDAKTIWNEKIDMGVNDVAKAFPWAYSKKVTTATCTASTAYVVLDEDFLELCPVDGVIYESGTDGAAPVTFLPEREFSRETDMEYDDTGLPTSATLRWDATTRRWRVYLKPIPGAAYTLRISYRVIQQTLAAEDTTIPQPSELNDLVLLNAVWRLSRHYNRPDVAERYAAYKTQLAEDRSTIGQRGQDGDWRFHDPSL